MNNAFLIKAKDKIRGHAINAFGWRTNRKIVVIESDDWGSVRTSSRESYLYFLKKGYKVNLCPYNRFDALECNDDLEMLLNVLSSVKDVNGNQAKITINNIVANPDFGKIKEAEFEQYSFEPFIQTLRRYNGRENVMRLYAEGIASKLLKPQFHGREHVNIANWMNDLKAGKEGTFEAFERGMFTVRVNERSSSREQYVESFGGTQDQFGAYGDIIAQGITLFDKIWGFRPQSFIAPCYTWPKSLEAILSKFHIRFLQGTFVQKEPIGQRKKGRIRRHYQGEVNSFNQRYMIRNVFFEPVEDARKDWVNEALYEIAVAFKWKKPAIISSHRVNYVGSIFRENRDQNIPKLKALLQSIIKRWPEVEFMYSDELGNLMNQNR